jgi:toxin-antitoxin system PIN domain toxin
MLLPDVNVCVYAIRADSPGHEAYRAWLDNALTGDEPVGMSELVLSGVVRLITNHRVFRQPSSTREALESCRALRSAPAVIPLRPGPRHWEIFESLCTEGGARANAVPDAYHAALAIENGATWITTDRGFARFPGLRWRRPFADGSTPRPE